MEFDPALEMVKGIPLVDGVLNLQVRHRFIEAHKRNREARCLFWSHEFGFELWLIVGELQRSQVCRSSDEVLDVQESWNATTIEKRWQQPEF